MNRRGFLGGFGAASLAGLSITEAAHAAPVADTWDVAWADRVTGKYRAVFDSPNVSEGAALVRAVAWCDHYKEVYGAPRTDMSPVIVFRHEAIALVMNDEYWRRYRLGKDLRIHTPDGKKWTEVNPIRAVPKGTPEQFAKYSLEKFFESGGIVLACNWAFGQAVATVQHKEKLDAKAARERALSMLVPGVILQPNGVFGVLRAQEAGCKYILAS